MPYYRVGRECCVVGYGGAPPGRDAGPPDPHSIGPKVSAAARELLALAARGPAEWTLAGLTGWPTVAGAARLNELWQAGLVESVPGPVGGLYRLTPAGRAEAEPPNRKR